MVRLLLFLFMCDYFNAYRNNLAFEDKSLPLK